MLKTMSAAGTRTDDGASSDSAVARARERVGSTPVSQGRWLLDVADNDPYDLDKDEWRVLQVELSVFVGRTIPSRHRTARWLRWVRQLLGLLVNGEISDIADVLLALSHPSRGGTRRRSARRKTQRITLFAILMALRGKLCRCDQCERLFIRRGRKFTAQRSADGLTDRGRTGRVGLAASKQANTE